MLSIVIIEKHLFASCGFAAENVPSRYGMTGAFDTRVIWQSAGGNDHDVRILGTNAVGARFHGQPDVDTELFNLQFQPIGNVAQGFVAGCFGRDAYLATKT